MPAPSWTNARIRKAIKLYFVERLSYEEVGRRLHSTAWGVRTVIYLPLGQRLRRQMKVNPRVTPYHQMRLIGKKFGLLTIVKKAGFSRYHLHVVCRCKCGTFRTVDLHNLIRGNTRSCGSKAKHYSGEKAGACFKTGAWSGNNKYTHRSYYKMLDRCLNEKRREYKYYGAKGVRVCKRWRESFFNFLEDVGRRPQGKSLDRINPYFNYSCGKCEECLREGWTLNCKWSTDLQQQVNTRKNHEPPVHPDSMLDDYGRELNPF